MFRTCIASVPHHPYLHSWMRFFQGFCCLDLLVIPNLSCHMIAVRNYHSIQQCFRSKRTRLFFYDGESECFLRQKRTISLRIAKLSIQPFRLNKVTSCMAPRLASECCQLVGPISLVIARHLFMSVWTPGNVPRVFAMTPHLGDCRQSLSG